MEEDGGVGGFGGVFSLVSRRTRLWRPASSLAKWIDESQTWQRKASSAAQNHLARLFRQLSHALAVFPPTAFAIFFWVIMVVIILRKVLRVLMVGKGKF